MEDQQKYANFSKASYKLYDPLKSKEQNFKNSLQVLSDVGINDFKIHPSSSNKRGVYINDNTKEIVIAHRGTDTSSKSNLMSDVAIALGFSGSTERFKRATRKDAKIKKAFPKHDITITGHSLGSQIGTQSATKNDMKGVFYNIGSGVPNLSSFIKDRRKINTNIKHYSTPYDPISIQSKKYPIIQIPVETKKGLNAHALENFV